MTVRDRGQTQPSRTSPAATVDPEVESIPGSLNGGSASWDSASARLVHLATTPHPLVIAAWLGVAAGFMMFFLQSDILYNSFVANQVARGHIDVYSWFQTHPNLRGIDTVMPPLYYLTVALYLKALMLIHLDPAAYNWKFLFTNVFHTHMGIVMMFGLILLKLPNLLAAAAGFYALLLLTSSAGEAKSGGLATLPAPATGGAALHSTLPSADSTSDGGSPPPDSRLVSFLWLASPALVVTALMQSQNDLIAVAITLFALVAFRRGRVDLMFLILGVAACFKTYPLILVPPAALLLSRRNLIRAVRFGVIAAIPLAVVSIPFVAGSYIHRVFGAHDAGSLLSASYSGRLPVHLWALGYLMVLGLAWILGPRSGPVGFRYPAPSPSGCAGAHSPESREQAEDGSPVRPPDIYDLVLIWFLPVAIIFVVDNWRPQWVVWLLPAVVLVGARDRVFAWLWVVANLAVLADDVLNYPGNMDGGMLEPFYGDRNHPANSHFYNYHLFHIWLNVPYAVLDGVYIVCGALFLALIVRACQWLLARTEMDLSFPRLPSVYAAALAGPFLLVPYIGTMIVQRLAG